MDETLDPDDRKELRRVGFKLKIQCDVIMKMMDDLWNEKTRLGDFYFGNAWPFVVCDLRAPTIITRSIWVLKGLIKMS